MKKSINQELYQTLKKEQLVERYFKKKEEEPFEEVIDITINEEDEHSENEANSSEKNNIKNTNYMEIDNSNSEIQNKILKNYEQSNCSLEFNPYNFDENNNYSNHSNFEIFNMKRNLFNLKSSENHEKMKNSNFCGIKTESHIISPFTRKSNIHIYFFSCSIII